MMIKVILLGVCVCILNMFLKQHQSAFTVIVNVCFIAVVIVVLIDSLTDTIDNIKSFMNFSTTAGKMFICLYKGALICILSKISSDICKESGNAVVSDIIDLAGRIMLLIISFPFIESIIKTASAFIS